MRDFAELIMAFLAWLGISVLAVATWVLFRIQERDENDDDDDGTKP